MNDRHEDATARCCAECGEEGGVSLKMCKSCMHARYCSAECQHKHWPKHKKDCKQRAAELRDEALFKDPPPKEDCPICFLPMPVKLISCASLPPATVTVVPIHDYAIANQELSDKNMEHYYPCCGKSICGGCLHSFLQSGNDDKCPFCNFGRKKTEEEQVEQITKWVAANDAVAMGMLATHYNQGLGGVQQDHIKAIELFTKSAELGCSKAHCNLGNIYYDGGNMKKAKFHFEATAMAGHEMARYNLGVMECNSGNMEQAIKHWTIGASAGECYAMHELRESFEKGYVSRESIDSTLAAYNDSCAEMRSEARDARIQFENDRM